MTPSIFGPAALTILLLQTAAAQPPRSTPSTEAVAASSAVLSLADAEREAMANHPRVRQAAGATDAAQARSNRSRSPLLPQVSANASYSRQTANFVPRPGALPANVAVTAQSSLATSDNFNFSLGATQLVYDFGQTWDGWRASKELASQAESNEDAIHLDVLTNVRSTFLLAWAQKALVKVAAESLANQDRRAADIEGRVKIGTRPEIDLFQAKADRASARVTLINAENAYRTAKAQLRLAMGREDPSDFDVTDDRLAPIAGEDGTDDALLTEAIAARPDLHALQKQRDAQSLQISAAKGSYGPSLGISTNISEAGRQIDSLVWNWNAGASLTWPLFQGGTTIAQVREATANRAQTDAQITALRQQVQLDITQARLSVVAAKAAIVAASEAEENARQRLRLAEARYQAGVGSILELQTAQVALTTVQGQMVQGEYALSLARAQLRKALGRR
jgi:outer membrane protein